MHHLLAASVATASLICAFRTSSVASSTSFSRETQKFTEISPQNGFTLNQDLLDWNEAFQECKTWGATLAFPKSADEGATLRGFLVNTINNSTKEIHLGFHDKFSEGNYTALEGRDMDEFGYWQWDPQSENGTEQRCGALTVDGMKTIDCDTRLQSICEYKGTVTFDKIDGFGYYLFVDLNMNWTQAIAKCKMETSHLLILRSVDEYDALFNHFTEKGVISGSVDLLYGAHQLYEDHWFLATSDEQIEFSGYDVWAPGEPGDGTGVDFPLVGLRLTDSTTPDADAGMFLLPMESRMPLFCKRDLH